MIRLIIWAALIVSPSLTKSKKVDSSPIETTSSSLTTLDYLRGICKEEGVPYQLIYEIGKNESGWRHIGDTSFVAKCWDTTEKSIGDLQVNTKYWGYFSKKYCVYDKSRLSLLKISVKHMAYLKRVHGTWRKARFVYGRGHWRGEDTWTCAEVSFMGKINWKVYD